MRVSRIMPAPVAAGWVILGPMRRAIVFLLTVLWAGGAVRAAEKVSWPLSLREGLPNSLPGYATVERGGLAETEENEMGTYTEVARMFQRIEGPASLKQFRLAVQDYKGGKDLTGPLKNAVEQARKAPGVEARELRIADRAAFVVTDRSTGNPTTLVTVVVTPSRLVLGQGGNVDGEEALKLMGRVDFARIAGAK